MKIGVPKEIKPQENRIGLTPQSVKTLTSNGHVVLVEKDGGFVTCFPNAFKWLRDGYYEAFLYVQPKKNKVQLESRNNIPF